MRTRTEQKQSAARKRWPAGKAIPNFETPRDEEHFWLIFEIDEGRPEDREEVVYKPNATCQARQHVYRVRLDDLEMAAVQELARRRGVTGAVVIRELVRSAAERRR